MNEIDYQTKFILAEVDEKLADCQGVEELKFYWQAVKVCEERLGEEHAETAKRIEAVANILGYGMCSYYEAHFLFLRAMEIYKKLFGLEHPKTVQCFKNVDSMAVMGGKPGHKPKC